MAAPVRATFESQSSAVLVKLLFDPSERATAERAARAVHVAPPAEPGARQLQVLVQGARQGRRRLRVQHLRLQYLRRYGRVLSAAATTFTAAALVATLPAALAAAALATPCNPAAISPAAARRGGGGGTQGWRVD